jgi:hypothetical protein
LALNTGVLSISTTQPPYSFDVPVNLGLNSNAAGSNLTITMTGANGSAPSATNPVSIPFRSGTLAGGQPSWGIITSAITLVIPSGATLGTSSSNVPFRIWLYASYNGGTPQLAAAVCSLSTQIYPCASWEYTRITSTTISGLATSAGVLYATAGVSSDPVRIIGYCDFASGLATAGSWASACTTLQLFGPGIKKPGDVVQTVVATTTTPTTFSGSTVSNKTALSLAGTITPSATVNLVKATAWGSMAVNTSATGTNVAVIQIYRGTGTTAIGNISIGNSNSTASGVTSPVGDFAFDNPASASSVQYGLYGWNGTGSSSNQWLNTSNSVGTNTGILTLEEIMGALDPANDNQPLSMVG